jgi:hypothetical protein
MRKSLRVIPRGDGLDALATSFSVLCAVMGGQIEGHRYTVRYSLRSQMRSSAPLKSRNPQKGTRHVVFQTALRPEAENEDGAGNTI